jgi:hypothetical protein
MSARDGGCEEIKEGVRKGVGGGKKDKKRRERETQSLRTRRRWKRWERT